MQTIRDAVAGVLDAMRQRGTNECSIRDINWSVYCPFINWHHENGTEICSFELLDSLCEHQKQRYENREIKRRYYRAFVTAAFRIRSYVASKRQTSPRLGKVQIMRENRIEFYKVPCSLG